jgi:hypothetical protein
MTKMRTAWARAATNCRKSLSETYKAEHAVDVESEAIVATTMTFVDKSDVRSVPVALSSATANLVLAGSEAALD